MSDPLELQGRHIVLGMSGGIACFKSAELVRELQRHGATVQVVMTEAAAQFITPVTMQALSNRNVYTSQWDTREPNAMAHINLTREADAVLVAPASADFMARLAQGRADELLSLLCLARPIERCPLLLAPAMNREMWGPGHAAQRGAAARRWHRDPRPGGRRPRPRRVGDAHARAVSFARDGGLLPAKLLAASAC